MSKNNSGTIESVFADRVAVGFNLRNRHGTPSNFVLPVPMLVELGNFLLDRRTGNLRINIKDGRILGYHSEEIVSL